MSCLRLCPVLVLVVVLVCCFCVDLSLSCRGFFGVLGFVVFVLVLSRTCLVLSLPLSLALSLCCLFDCLGLGFPFFGRQSFLVFISSSLSRLVLSCGGVLVFRLCVGHVLSWETVFCWLSLSCLCLEFLLSAKSTPGYRGPGYRGFVFAFSCVLVLCLSCVGRHLSLFFPSSLLGLRLRLVLSCLWPLFFSCLLSCVS